MAEPSSTSAALRPCQGEPGPARELHPGRVYGGSELDRHAEANAILAGSFRRAFVGIVPKIDTHGKMNMKGSKCANTPTPARQPLGRRSDMASMPPEDRPHRLGECEYCDLGLDHDAPAQDMCPECDRTDCAALTGGVCDG